MELTPRERLAAGGAAALGIALVLASVFGTWRLSFLLLGALVAWGGAVTMVALRRQDRIRRKALDRLERKVDNLALRVVTESEAMHRELGGLLEDLGAAVRGHGVKEG